MRRDELTESRDNVTLTRREMIKVSIGVAAGSLLTRPAGAGEIDNMTDIGMEAAIIFDPHIPEALRQALEYAGDDGFVASLPALLHARATANYDSIMWNTWFTANTEESVVTTLQGNHVVVAVHGGGIFASPARFERVYRATVDRSSPEGFTGQYAAKITRQEARDVLAGRLPDGTEIPVYPFEEFRRGIANLPLRYGVILDYELARNSSNARVPFEDLKDDPTMIVRAGGVEANAVYLDKYQARHNTRVSGNWNPFNRIDPDQPQTRVLYLGGNRGAMDSEGSPLWLGYDSEYGIGGDPSMMGLARYVAVAPPNSATNFQYTDIEL